MPFEGVELDEQAFAFDHYDIVWSHQRTKAVSTGTDLPFFYLLEEEFTVYEGTELVNLINPGRPIVSNNLLVKYGRIRRRGWLKRVPKKKPRKPIDWNKARSGSSLDFYYSHRWNFLLRLIFMVAIFLRIAQQVSKKVCIDTLRYFSCKLTKRYRNQKDCSQINTSNAVRA